MKLVLHRQRKAISQISLLCMLCAKKLGGVLGGNNSKGHLFYREKNHANHLNVTCRAFI